MSRLSRLVYALTCVAAVMAACDARAYYRGYSQGKKCPAVSVRSDHTRLAVQVPDTIEPPAPGPVQDGAGPPAHRGPAADARERPLPRRPLYRTAHVGTPPPATSV